MKDPEDFVSIMIFPSFRLSPPKKQNAPTAAKPFLLLVLLLSCLLALAAMLSPKGFVSNSALAVTLLPSLALPANIHLNPSSLSNSDSDKNTNNLVILVSLDGFRPDYLDLGLTPTLSQIGNDGVRANQMQPVFPSITFPNHYTLVTGLYPESHGIIGNVIWDPLDNTTIKYTDPRSNMESKWWTAAEPLWTTAELQGVRSGVCMWPGSEAPFKGLLPSLSVKYSNMSIDEKVDRVLGWLDLPPNLSPRLLTMYIGDVDTAGHNGGAFSTGVRSALEHVDLGMKKLVGGIAERGLTDKVNLVVVSDHGMTNSSLDRIIYLEDFMDVNAVKIVDNNPIFLLFPINPSTAFNLFHHISLFANNNNNQSANSSSHFQVYRKPYIPDHFHYQNNYKIAPIILVADLGWVFVDRREKFNKKYMPNGMHGYDNTHKDMQALFVASGPNVIQSSSSQGDEGVETPFLNLEVYKFVCDLLGIIPNPNNSTSSQAALLEGWRI